MDRVDWDTYFMDIATLVAKRSTCLRAPDGVGAVLAEHTGRIIATGYAGSVAGAPHCTEVGCLIDEQTGGCVRTIHAEMNALIFARTDLRGTTCYTTLSPCWACFRVLVQAGVARFVYGTEYRLGVAKQRDLATRSGVTLHRLGAHD